MDSERATQEVILVPTSLCVSSKGHRGAHVPVEETEKYLDPGEEATVGKGLETRSKWTESGTSMKGAGT